MAIINPTWVNKQIGSFQTAEEMNGLAVAIKNNATELETNITNTNAKVDKTTTVNGKPLSSNITLDKTDIGLGNVNNTSDLNKPISTSMQLALDGKANTTVNIIAGNGLTGGGTVIENVTLNVVSVDDGITVNADNIKLNTIDDLVSESTTKPLSAAQGRTLNLTKVSKSGNESIGGIKTFTESPVVPNPVNDTDAVNKDYVDVHITNLSNPHQVNKVQIGLGNVDNTSDINKPVSTLQQAAIDSATGGFSSHLLDTNNPHNVTATQVGLGNVNNTSDMDKPVSTAINNALDLKANKTTMITAGQGLNGGGTLATNRTIDVVCSDDSITVAVDSLKVNTVNDLDTLSPTRPLSASQGYTLNNTKVNKSTTITAGNGLVGGGDLSLSRTLDVASADDGILVNVDNVKLNIVNDLVTTSATRPVSATQAKALQDTKVTKTGDETIAGIKTFTSIPKIPTTTPTLNEQVASKKYVDDVNAINVADEKTMFPAIAYNKRVLLDSGTVISKQSVIDGYKTMIDLLPNTKLLYNFNSGVKTRTVGINSYLTKAYDMGINTLDGTQIVESSQPFLSGGISPNESRRLKFNSGTSKSVQYTLMNFSNSSSWSLTIVIKLNKYRSYISFGNSYLYFTSTNTTISIGGGTEITASYIAEIGKTIVCNLMYDNGNIRFVVNGIVISNLTSLNATLFNIINNSVTYPIDGELYHYQLFDKVLNKTEIINTYNYLRSQYPEIESVAIGNQVWSTSNYEGIVTGNGTVIPEVQSASTSVAPELITNQSDREFTSDTLWWSKVGTATIHDGICTIYSSDGIVNAYLRRDNLLSIGKMYSFSYTISANRSGYLAIESTGTGIDLQLDSTIGTHIVQFRSNSTNFVIKRYYGTTVDIDIDNISIKEIGWSDLTTPAWCYYNNDPALGSVYGKLYNYYAVQAIAANPPKGWRVPTNNDFTQLSNYLGGSTIAGGKLKKDGLVYWTSPNSGATNESGFSAIAGGYRVDNGSFVVLTYNSVFMSSDGYRALVRQDDPTLSIASSPLLNYGRSIRLLRNEPAGDQVQSIKIDSFTTNITEGTANKDISIPFGYVVDNISVLATTAITDFKCQLLNTSGVLQSVLLEGKTADAGVKINYKVYTDQVYQFTDPVLRFNCAGNTGLEIVINLTKIS